MYAWSTSTIISSRQDDFVDIGLPSIFHIEYIWNRLIIINIFAPPVLVSWLMAIDNSCGRTSSVTRHGLLPKRLHGCEHQQTHNHHQMIDWCCI